MRIDVCEWFPKQERLECRVYELPDNCRVLIDYKGNPLGLAEVRGAIFNEHEKEEIVEGVLIDTVYDLQLLGN